MNKKQKAIVVVWCVLVALLNIEIAPIRFVSSGHLTDEFWHSGIALFSGTCIAAALFWAATDSKKVK